ncbi:hypothetical protein CR513_06641, partial [Mucuna pruriens]
MKSRLLTSAYNDLLCTYPNHLNQFCQFFLNHCYTNISSCIQSFRILSFLGNIPINPTPSNQPLKMKQKPQKLEITLTPQLHQKRK